METATRFLLLKRVFVAVVDCVRLEKKKGNLEF